MADVKISALTAATTPLAGTEVLPIVQSGVTVKVAVSNLTAGRAVALGATTITGAATISTTLGVTGITTVAAGSAALPAIVSTTGTADTGLWFPAADTVAASTAGTERLRIDSSGNVGIGTASPGSKLHVVSSSGENKIISEATAASQQASMSLIVQAATPGQTVIYMGKTGATTNGQLGYDPNTNAMTIYTNNAERMRIDSSGNLLVGTTSTSVTSGGYNFLINDGGTGYSTGYIGHATGCPSGYAYLSFKYAGTALGTITQNGTTGVLYNLTSDYRLKNDQQPLTGAKEFVMALQPKKWQWWDGSGEGVGFIAHEFMEVAKYSGHGEKDAVEMQTYEISPAVPATKDKEGNEVTAAVEAVMGEREVPKYQSIQPSSSEVMANLVAHIQELESRLAALEAKA